MGGWSARWVGVGTALAVACGGGGVGASGQGELTAGPKAEQVEPYVGDPMGPPSVESLPESDVPRSKLSEEMRRAWLLAEEALAVPPPVPPQGAQTDNLQQWSDTVLKHWMELKTERSTAARRELNEAADNSQRERILAGALLGLVYEDVGRVLVDLPLPDELRDEPEIAEIYRDVMRSHAQPFLSNARTAYEACAGNARQSEALSHWGRYCRLRREVLPGQKIEAVSGTVVTVEPE